MNPLINFMRPYTSTLSTSLATYIKFDNNTTCSITGTSHNGGVAGTFSTPKVGTYSYYMSGTKYITYSSGFTQFSNTTTSRSAAIWIKPTISQTGYLMQHTRYGGKFYLSVIPGDSGFCSVKLWIVTNSGNENFTTSSTSVPIDAWTHYAVSINMTAYTVTAYINGVEDTTTSPSMAGTSFSTEVRSPVFGCYYSGDGYNNRYTGYMDEFATWNKALTPSEVQELYCSGFGNQYPFTP